MSAGKGVIVGIQHLRGLAASAVAVYHASRLNISGQDGGALPYLAAAGDFGLQLFFVISGFIITVVCLDESWRPRIGLSDFLRRRFIRIVPVMWAAIAVYVVLKLGSGGGVDWLATLRAAVLWPVGEFKPGLIWTLRLEFTFYLIFAFAMILGRPRPWLIGIWVLLPLVTRLAAPYFPALAADGQSDSFVWVHLMGHQVGANLQFGAGVILGLLWKRGSSIVRGATGGGFLVLFAICAVSVVVSEFIVRAGLPDLVRIPVQTAMVAVIALLGIRARPQDSKAERVGKFLGDASYSIYLFHALALPIVERGLAAVSSVVRLPAPLVAIIAASLAIAAGILAYLVIERPLLRRLERKRDHGAIASSVTVAS